MTFSILSPAPGYPQHHVLGLPAAPRPRFALSPCPQLALDLASVTCPATCPQHCSRFGLGHMSSVCPQHRVLGLPSAHVLGLPGWSGQPMFCCCPFSQSCCSSRWLSCYGGSPAITALRVAK